MKGNLLLYYIGRRLEIKLNQVNCVFSSVEFGNFLRFRLRIGKGDGNGVWYKETNIPL
jgi:hypothetical protein